MGYRYADGTHRAMGFEFVPARPAGAMSATAPDMARFMIAHLQDGRYGSARVLSDTTARQMHGRAFSHGPSLNGVLLGFYEMSRKGRKIYGHDGDTFDFHSHLALLPEEGVGLFVSFNTDTGAQAREDLISAFLDRYFPAREGPPRPALSPADAARFAGTYAPGRVSQTTLTRLERLTGAVRVRATPEGHPLTRGFGPTPKRWARDQGLLFRQLGGGETLAFREDDRGRVTHLFFDRFPPIHFVRLGATETPAFQFTVLGTCGLLLLSAAVIWPLGVRPGRHVGPGAAEAIRARLARLLAWLVCVLCVAFLVALGVVLADPTEIAFGLPPLVPWLLALPLVAAVLTAPVLGFAIQAWRQGYWHVLGRVHYSVVAVAAVVFLVWLHQWNLLGFRY